MTPRVAVSPIVLEWAADQTDMEPDALYAKFPSWDHWLAGDRQPTLKQLEDLAARAGVPFGYLLLNEPPRLELPVPDFREGLSGLSPTPSSDLMAVVNQSVRRQDWYLGFARDTGLPPVSIVGVGASMNVVDAALTLREALNFQVEARSGRWANARKHLVMEFENLGGLTVVTSMVENNTHRLLNPDEFRGFTLIDPLAPLVFVNAHQTLNGQIFTLAHEFAHVLRGQSGISAEDPGIQAQSAVETWCNAVASEFLVPGADLRIRYRRIYHLPLTEQLDILARAYRCGTLVVLQAIRHHGLAEFEDFAATYRAELERLEQFSALPGDSEGGSFYNNQPFRIGDRLSRAIVGDTLEGRTNFSEALRLMSFKSLSNFDAYAEHLGVR